VRAGHGPRRSVAAVALLVAAGLVAWAWRMWPEWREDPDLSHGFLALPLLGMLLQRARASAADECRCSGGRAELWRVTLVGLLVAALPGVALLAVVYAVALGWSATPTLFLLGVLAAAGAALFLALAAGREPGWIRPCWPAAVIPLVLLLSSPLPPGSYERLTLGLQEMITGGVLEALRLIGVPALRAGNVIQLGSTSVGVEEACSGVRSLVSCVLAGLVLSALMLRSPRRRVCLVLVAAPLALASNFARSLALTLLAHSGVEIAGAWHDGLGFAVLGVTTGLLLWLAVTLEAGEASASRIESGAHGLGGREWADRGPSRSLGLEVGVARAGLVSALVALGMLGFAAGRGAQGDAVGASVPALGELLPSEPEAAGWEVLTRGDLDRFAGVLRTSHLLERVYRREDGAGRLVQISVYVAWWGAGQASVSTVAAHTPEACWPGAGWTPVASGSARRSLPLADGREVADAEQRAFIRAEYPQQVWFWHLVGGEPFRAFEPRSWRDQLEVFFAEGTRGEREQVFVRISSNRDWEVLAEEPLVAELLGGLAELGVPLGEARGGRGSGP
jgi:exosortase